MTRESLEQWLWAHSPLPAGLSAILYQKVWNDRGASDQRGKGQRALPTEWVLWGMLLCVTTMCPAPPRHLSLSPSSHPPLPPTPAQVTATKLEWPYVVISRNNRMGNSVSLSFQNYKYILKNMICFLRKLFLSKLKHGLQKKKNHHFKITVMAFLS